MTLKCTHILVSVGSSLLQKKINQQHINHWFLPLLGFCHSRKKIYFHTYWEKNKCSPSPWLFAQVFKRCSGVHCQTVLYNEWNQSTELVIINKITFKKEFQASSSDKISIPEVTKLRSFFLTRCPLLFTCWLG